MGERRLDAPVDAGALARILARLGISHSRYILCVGTVEPRKNLTALLDALRDIRADASADVPHCVIVGRDGWKSDDIRKRLRTTNFEFGTVTWVQNVSDVELSALYDGALFTVVPS